MTTEITRRTALGALAIPGALVGTSGHASTSEPDPAIAAYNEWRAARLDHFPRLRAVDERFFGKNTEEARAARRALKPYDDRVTAAEERLSNTVATSPEGLELQLRFASEWGRDPETSGSAARLDDREWILLSQDLMRSIREGVRRLAEQHQAG